MIEHFSMLSVGGTLLLTVLILIMVGVTWWFDVRHARLPQATRLEDLSERNASLIGQISEKQAELTDLQRRIQDRDRVGAEVAALIQQREALQLEMAAMADTELQIDQLKRRTADAAMEHAEIKQQLDTVLAEKEAVDTALSTAKKELAALPTDQAELQRNIERLQGERLSLETDLAGLRTERATLVAAREEMISLTGRSAALRGELERISADYQQQLESLASIKADLVEKQEERLSVLTEIAVLQPLKAEVQALAAERARLLPDIENLTDEKQKLSSMLEELAIRLAKDQELLVQQQIKVAEVERIRNEVDALTARKAAIELEIDRNENGRGSGTPTGNDNADLSKPPECLAIHGTKARPQQDESEAIEEVRQSLIQHGLKYSSRTVDAFHTSLKINEVAQLTVLAGVSGTGKSLLPRRYAEAMGISFLPIAVEPRWDSPQDLLGFYNYVEKRYRGTELARALVHMDPYNTSGLASESFGDRMLLVMLDEMNLARVEYYFSEFLSRLEIRPRWSRDLSEAERRQASMPLDARGQKGDNVRGQKDGSVLLFPSHNVLFVGTMNDDESTQALSDKVLDRGNVMQFPAPVTFERQQSPQRATAIAKGHLDYQTWRGWIRDRSTMDLAESEQVQKIINRLADIMQRCGRPFGHRLNEAVLTYVSNYPKSAVRKLRVKEALADQVELRILPKLRGVVIDEGDSRSALDDMVKLIRTELQDSDFADELQKIVDSGMNQFNWRGLDRGRV
jgi:hypothetical protein